MSTACVLEAVRVGVPDIAGALPLYRDLLGGREVATGALAFPGGVRIELEEDPERPPGLLAVRWRGPAPRAPDPDEVQRVCGGPLVEVSDGQVPAVVPGTGPVGAARVTDFDHAAFAVADFRAAVALFVDGLGGTPVMGGDNPQGMRAVQVRYPAPAAGSKAELLTPSDDTAFIARYLERHGPGLHHLTFMVEDVAEAEEAALAAGFPVTGTDLADPDWRETFLRPGSAFGTLIQFANTARPKPEPLAPDVVAEIIEGRWEIARNIMRRRP